MAFNPLLLFYVAPLAMIWALSRRSRVLAEGRFIAAKAAAKTAGLTEPASLHPAIDETRCLGCGACLKACPEGGVLGLIDGRAELVQPSNCVGHGACRTACPNHAIKLVLGTESQGVDVPVLDPDFQTNVPGIFVAGELGGMGLIRNAVMQGRQAVEAIGRMKTRLPAPAGAYDVVVVGSGPAGLAASLAAKAKGLSAVTLEQGSLGGAIAHFPRGKIVTARPAELPLVGKVAFGEMPKERLLAFWRDVVDETGIAVRCNERAETITRLPGGGFEVTTPRARYRARAVVLALGRRGAPRKLGVEGDDLTKVVNGLAEPAQYRGKRVAIVGGGDSAIEAALALADQPGTEVLLVHRGEAFARAKAANRARLEERAAAGRIDVRLQSAITAISERSIDVSDGVPLHAP